MIVMRAKSAARASPAVWRIRNWIILSYIWESTGPDGSPLKTACLDDSGMILARLRKRAEIKFIARLACKCE